MKTIRPNTPQIELRAAGDLKPYENSPRLHSRGQRRKLTALLRRYGQVIPVIVDADDVIVDGHLVVEALKDMGEETIKVVVAGHDPTEIKALRLALNRVPQDAKWNRGKLKAEFETLLNLAYDLDLTGFDAVEIDFAFAIDEPGVGGVESAPDGPAQGGVPVTRIGDLLQLGAHRVLCGDAREPEGLARLMGGDTARMAFLDVPYNVPIKGFVSGGSHREFAMASGEMSDDQFVTFLEDALRTAAATLCDGAILYVCIDWRGLTAVSLAASRVGLAQLNLCVWSKTNAGMGAFYRSQHELIPVFKKGTAPHQNNFELGQKGRSRSNVWSYRGMNAFGAERDDLLKVHPTVKPLALVIDAVKDVSGRGDIVIDTFLGSGTTLIAAEETGRRCYGVEFDPLYVDVIIRRWQAHTGQAAYFVGTSESFDAREGSATQASLSQVTLRLPAPPERGDPAAGER